MPKRRHLNLPAARAADSFAFELNALSREIDAALLKRALGLTFASLAGVGLGAAPGLAEADTFLVDTTIDENDGTCTGDCSLRDAVAAANANGNGPATLDQISFSSSVTGTLTLDIANLGNIDITDDLTITGPGADQLVISGDDVVPDFNEDGGIFRATSSGTLTLENLTLEDGRSNGNGGALFADNTSVVLNAVTIRGSAAHNGGGFWSNGSVTLTNSNILSNRADSDGGGFWSSGSATLIKSTINDNYADSDGGGFWSSGSAALTNSIVNDNAANDGGGFFVDSGVATLTTSGVSANSASGKGGGFFVVSGNASLTNSTVSGNTANADGGGMFVLNGDAILANSTVSGNLATDDGGGFSVNYGNATLEHSILANNTTTSASADEFVVSGAGATLTVNYSLVYGTSSPTVTGGTGNLIGSAYNPDLGPLQDNGGPTFTHALLTTSPAIDAGGSNCDAGDQRGVPRPYNSACDMGAYEFAPNVQTGPELRVTNTSDPGDGYCTDTECTLREAISIANIASVPNTVTFSSTIRVDGGTITLGTGQGEITITDELTILGPGADTLTVDANSDPADAKGESRIFYATSAATLTTITGLTLTNGYTSGSGGAIYTDFSNLALDGVVLKNNEAGDSGGGFLVHEADTFITNSTISGNTANRGAGFAAGDDLTLSYSTVSGNTANSNCGGFFVFGADATLANCTISGNSADKGGGFCVYGGGNAYLDNSTVSYNTATTSNGGFWLTSGNATLANSIVAGNTAPSNEAFSVSGTVDANFNLIDGSNSGYTGTGNIGGNPYLGLLADNGGQTYTHALQSGSPVIDEGSSAYCPATDQRGALRPVDGNDADTSAECDMGAFEYDSVPPQIGPDFVVTNTSDPGDGVCLLDDCTLREAINAANANNDDPDTVNQITFAASVSGTIVLQNGQMDITDELTITGPGSNLLAVDANSDPADAQGESRIFHATADLKLYDLTLTNGYTVNNGGAIVSNSDLWLEGVTVEKSYAGSLGGGFAVIVGNAILTSSTVSDNTADYGGGFSLNRGNATLTNSTVSDNLANVKGGGFSVFYGDATITHSTVSGNTASDGGGLFVFGHFAFATIATLENSIVANNTAVNGANDEFVISGSNTSLTANYSLVYGTSSPTVTGGTGNLIGSAYNPHLGPLQANGGPTPTHALLPGSPAIDAGGSNCEATDQRGLPRPQGSACDMGAFEFGPDADGDGLDDLAESGLGTNPNDTDTDGDGINDGTEVSLGTDPNNSDTDGDGLGDSVDSDPTAASNACTGTDAIFGVPIPTNTTVQCAAENSVRVTTDLVINATGGRAEVFTPNTIIEAGFAVAMGAEFAVEATTLPATAKWVLTDNGLKVTVNTSTGVEPIASEHDVIEAAFGNDANPRENMTTAEGEPVAENAAYRTGRAIMKANGVPIPALSPLGLLLLPLLIPIAGWRWMASREHMRRIQQDSGSY